MVLNLPEHDHCKFCGDPIPFDMAYCSEECYYKEQERVKKEKKQWMNLAVICIIGLAVIIALGLLV